MCVVAAGGRFGLVLLEHTRGHRVALDFKRIDTSVMVANEAGALVLGLEAF